MNIPLDPKVEFEIINLFCTYCGEKALTCDIALNLKNVPIVALQNNKASIDVIDLLISELKGYHILMRCSNGHEWVRCYSDSIGSGI